MSTRIRAAVTAAIVVIGLALGGVLVAAKNVGAPPHLTNCNPVADKADWMLNHESTCYEHNAPPR